LLRYSPRGVSSWMRKSMDEKCSHSTYWFIYAGRLGRSRVGTWAAARYRISYDVTMFRMTMPQRRSSLILCRFGQFPVDVCLRNIEYSINNRFEISLHCVRRPLASLCCVRVTFARLAQLSRERSIRAYQAFRETAR